jgi:hypothetical protein
VRIDQDKGKDILEIHPNLSILERTTPGVFLSWSTSLSIAISSAIESEDHRALVSTSSRSDLSVSDSRVGRLVWCH